MEIAAVILPGIAALIVGLFGRIIGDRASQLITVMAVILAALISFYILAITSLIPALHGVDSSFYITRLFTWIDVGGLEVDWALRIDTLSAIMLLVVNGVSACVHVYSIGYMSHDPDKPRFMAYLSLFTFAMLMLVTANNLVQMFFGWEGVGLASYLLIGFWIKKPTANAASIKAFVVNRIGDFGFALGIFTLFFIFDSVTFTDLFNPSEDILSMTLPFLSFDVPAIELACGLLFIGAMGKSAQLFLHTWLPDAMEGPTPVSALIHAATMVTAGVFMMVRMSPLLEYAPHVLMIITIIGAATAFIAATIGLTQNDIKRVIAYSTMSQLGYMFFAIGVSAYSAAIFHLFTHAFFKALLFLGAGSVIHALGDEQDLRKMGGLWRKIPYTYIVMIGGSLALAGVPIFAGYYSKDIILESAFIDHSLWGNIAYYLGIAAAFMTAFYAFRLIFMAFHGKAKSSDEVMSHVHEAPPSMMLPLLVLFAGAVLSGVIFVQFFIGIGAEWFWGSAIFVEHANDTVHLAHYAKEHGNYAELPLWAIRLPLILGGSGFTLALLFYIIFPKMPVFMAKITGPLYRLSFNKWYFDEIYDFLIVRPFRVLARILWRRVDIGIIDRFGPDGLVRLTKGLSRGVSRFQTGYMYHYAFIMVIGVVLILAYYLYTQNLG